MAIKVKTGAALRNLLGGRMEVVAEGATVGELLDNLGIRDRLCDGGNLRRHFNIHVNDGEDIRLQKGLDTSLQDGDTVSILSAIAGGELASGELWLTIHQKMVDKPPICEVGQRFETYAKPASSLELSGNETEIKREILFPERRCDGRAHNA